MTDETKRTPEQWCQHYDLTIHDPDGWRTPDAPAWEQPISLPEFWRRFAASTVAHVPVEKMAAIVADVRVARQPEQETDLSNQRLRDVPLEQRTQEITRRYMASRYLESAWGRDEVDFIIGHLISELDAAKNQPAEVTELTAELIGEPLSPLYCLGCLVETHSGQPAEPNPAWTIVNGAAHCREHLKFQDGPVLPDRTPGGILLPGQNGAAT